MLTYINKKNKEVELQITRHAYAQFAQRFPLIFEHEVENKNVLEVFEYMFKAAQRVKNLNWREKMRIKKYGQDTMFFRTSGLTFVVKNATIVTVEISDKDKRYLNKVKHAQIA